MATIITRSGKGSPLTNNEVDANFTNLNSDKIESGDTVASLTITNADINGGDIASGVTVNKSPQLTLTGDVTGTVTFTNLANGSMTTTASADLLRVDGDGSDLTDVRAETLEVTIKNVTASSIAKGTPVHQTGFSGSGTFEVQPADASNASLMPAHFIAGETLAAGAEGRGLVMGRITGVNTSGFSEGDTVYVAVGGGYTNVAPTGEGNLVQNLGTVTRVDATQGGGEITGAGRANATPNLNNGNIFIGNASNQAVTASLSTSVSNAGFATTTYVDTAVANLVDSAPAALDTLNELAAALGDDANFSTTVTNSIALKQDAATALTTSTTFGGDVSGTYNAIVVADDSHNHIIGNVDGLQAALDAKQAAATAVTTTTTFGGDVSGTYDAIVIADDSHNHIIGNIDGLQAALDAKQDGSTALTTTTTFGGDVSGTYNAIVVADDSHNHIIGNVDGLQTALDGKLGSTANAVSASKWATARTVSLTGAVTGSASVDGSANVSIATTHTADPTITLTGAVTGSGTMTNLGNVSIATTATADPTLTLAGDVTGSATFTNLGNATLTATVANDSHTHDGRYFTETESDGRYLRTGADSVTSARLAVGAHIGSRSPGFSVEGDADSSPFVVKTSARATAFAVLPWSSGYTYISSGIYYDDGAWVHSSDNAYNCLLEISGTSGGRWYASDNSSGSWNLASALPLWNNAGTWVAPVSSSSVTATTMYVDQYIYHNGDTNTYIDFQADRMRIVAGGVEMIDNIEGGTDYVQIANAQLTVYTAGNAALTGSLTYNPDGGSVTTETNEGSINYVYNSTGGTPTRGACGVHVYQQWSNNLSLALTSSSWVQGDIVRVSNVRGTANITVSATRIYTPDGSYDTSVTFNGTVGGFVLAKYSTTQGYWMVLS